ncbi:MAG: bacillithiol biosynthesis deacetylase BshB1 [Candidatus Absconditabacterales bacterium]|nr:bacillithiol biosynthesis deacetylase BshB1 [Candidatus Absconditabacterales bacterium]
MIYQYGSYICAFGPHPDDVDIGCGGTIWQATQQGKKTIIIDCSSSLYATRGTEHERREEAQKAGSILGAHERINLMMQDCHFADTHDQRHRIVTVLRQYKPEIVLVPHHRDRHPDHAILSTIVYNACFLSGLTKYISHDDTDTPQTPHRPRLILAYQIWNDADPDIIMAISPQALEAKFHAFQSFHTQNPTNQHAFDYFRSRATVLGFRIKQPYGEGFCVINEKLGITSFDHLISGYR